MPYDAAAFLRGLYGPAEVLESKDATTNSISKVQVELPDEPRSCDGGDMAATPCDESPAVDASERATRRCCRCGSNETIDVSIHGGQSIRRECAMCGRFVGFPVWYGLA
jgi:hypothetical protein